MKPNAAVADRLWESTGAKVLEVAVLEDNPVDAVFLERMLTQAWRSISVTRFSTVGDLESALDVSRPDVIFADLSLPDASGVEVIGRIRSKVLDAPVVVMTGDEDPAMAVSAIEAGAQDYLVKGQYDVDLLSRSLRHSLARCQADRQLRRTSNALARSNDELDQYGGIVAHDLRAPVRTARLLADRMIAASARTDRSVELAGRLDGCLSRLEELISGLLRIASIRDGGLHPAREHVSEIFADVVSDLQADSDHTAVKIEQLSDTSVLADPVLVRDLLRNLIGNSLKYRSPERDLVVTVEAEEVNGFVELSVTDNGIGIEPEYRTRIFRLFERLHSDTAIPGVGYGLAMCHRVAELHDGSIRITEPANGVGTTVVVSFPASEDPEFDPGSLALIGC